MSTCASAFYSTPPPPISFVISGSEPATGVVAFPKMGNRLHLVARIRERVRNFEARHDIRPNVRVKTLASMWEKAESPQIRAMILGAMRRVTRQGKRPKYPVFYKVGPLVEKAFDDVELPNLGMGDLVDRLISQLRLTTLARSGDLARVVWGLFQQDGQFFLRFTDKNAALQTASAQPATVATIREYMSRHLYHPGEFLMRCVSDPSRPMGAQRIAKRTVEVMGGLGIDTRIFKAHSLRGAAATAMMEQGVPKDHVQARGGWRSSATLEEYYARLHQGVQWERVLLGGNGKGGMSNSASPVSTTPRTGDDEGNRRGGVEKKGEAQVDILAARGVLRPLHSSTKCVVCGLSATMEAAYKCFTCDAFGHVRCMGPGPAGTRKDARDIRCTRCARAASMNEIGMFSSSSNQDDSQADALIVDVMGVCLGESGRVGRITSL